SAAAPFDTLRKLSFDLLLRAGRAEAQLPDESLHVGVECSVLHELRLSIDELLQIVWQQADIRHRCIVQQYRNHRNAAPQRFANLDPHKIAWIVQSSAVGFRVACIDPSTTDEREQNFTLLDPALNDLSEIVARSDRVHIHEHMIARNDLAECRMDHASLIFGVIAAVADEDFCGHGAVRRTSRMRDDILQQNDDCRHVAPRGTAYPSSVNATFYLAITEAMAQCPAAETLMMYVAHCAGSTHELGGLP